LNFIGHRLFPDKHAYTVTFYLNREEFELYKLSQLFSASRCLKQDPFKRATAPQGLPDCGRMATLCVSASAGTMSLHRRLDVGIP
jgi:hypothetical protein